MRILEFSIFSLFLNFSLGYKILVYNVKFGTSHVNFLGKVADILVRAGHDVTVYAPTIDDSILTNGTKLAKVILRPRDFPMETNLKDDKIQDRYWKSDDLIDKLHEDFTKLCKKQFVDAPLINRLKNEKFDIAIVEHFDYCFYGILKKIGLKNYITVSSTKVFESVAGDMGVPSPPSFIPVGLIAAVPPFTLSQRIENLFYSYLVTTGAFHDLFGHDIIKFFKENDYPNFDISKEISNSVYYFANVDEHVESPRTISHKIIYIGGLDRKKAQPLDKKYTEVIEKSKKGFVLISFGTVALSHTMPDRLKQVFLKTFANFPDITFIWKYEKDEHKIADGYPNVITEKWVPQNDLLEHPKLLAFISHGGMNSVQEGASKGIPMLMVPIFADQPRNAKSLEYRKMAITLNKDTLTVEQLTDSLKKIIEDDSYRKNAKRLASLIAEKPESAEERVVKYTEFAAKFGPDLNLDMYGRHMGFFEYYCLDIIALGVIILLISVYLGFLLLKKIFKSIFAFIVPQNKKKFE